MTPHEYMRKQAHGVGGGIAWTQQAFAGAPGLAPEALVDAAVDIARERLQAKALKQLDLEVERRENLIVFRAREAASNAALAQLATIGEAASPRTYRRLCQAAMTGWPYESRLPGRDLPGVLQTAAVPHLRRLTLFRLLQQWRLGQAVRAN